MALVRVKDISRNLAQALDSLPKKEKIAFRLRYLRRELREGRLSYYELAELQSLKKYIDPGDTELLEAAGVPEGQKG